MTRRPRNANVGLANWKNENPEGQKPWHGHPAHAPRTGSPCHEETRLPKGKKPSASCHRRMAVSPQKIDRTESLQPRPPGLGRLRCRPTRTRLIRAAFEKPLFC